MNQNEHFYFVHVYMYTFRMNKSNYSGLMSIICPAKRMFEVELIGIVYIANEARHSKNLK